MTNRLTLRDIRFYIDAGEDHGERPVTPANQVARLASELLEAREQITELEVRLRGFVEEIDRRLSKHRTSSTQNVTTGEYKNPVRKGYDMALTEVLDLMNPTDPQQ